MGARGNYHGVFHEIPWHLQTPIEFPWRPTELRRVSWDLHGATMEAPWWSMESPWKVHGLHGTSMELTNSVDDCVLMAMFWYFGYFEADFLGRHFLVHHGGDFDANHCFPTLVCSSVGNRLA